MNNQKKSFPPAVQEQAQQMLSGLEHAYREIMSLRSDPVRMRKRADALNVMCLNLKKQIEDAHREQDAWYARTQQRVAAYRKGRLKKARPVNT